MKITLAAGLLLGTGMAVTSVVPHPDLGADATQDCIYTSMGDFAGCMPRPEPSPVALEVYRAPRSGNVPDAERSDAI